MASIRVDLDTHRNVKDIAYLQDETMAEVIGVAVLEFLGARPALQHRLNVIQKAIERQGLEDGSESTE